MGPTLDLVAGLLAVLAVLLVSGALGRAIAWAAGLGVAASTALSWLVAGVFAYLLCQAFLNHPPLLVSEPWGLVLGAVYGLAYAWALASMGFYTPWCERSLFILAGLAAPVGEELLFRGFIQELVATRYGVVAGVAVQAALFSTLHYGKAHSLLLALLYGLGAGAIKAYTGSLAPVILSHAVANTVLLALSCRGVAEWSY